MFELEFDLHLTQEKYLSYYQGKARTIQVQSICGKVVYFSADKVRKFVTHQGVHGRFIIRLNDDCSFVSLSQRV